MPSNYERALARLAPDVLAETVRICEIPSPTFRERRRARYVHSQLEEIGGWDQLTIDGLSNVVAIRRGRADAARVLVSAHLDTVFPDVETPVTRTRGRLSGRGVGDVLFAANAGEEGRGDLRGIRRLLRDYRRDIDCAIAIEGHSLNRVQVGGVGSIRYEVSVQTEGGHSWGAYGRDNAISLLARAITALEPVMPEVGVTPKTTMNVGVIRGGRSVNTIAPDAVFELDMRSEDPAALDALRREARRAMRRALAERRGKGQLRLRRIGLRPAARIPSEHALIRTVLRARRGSG